MNTYHICVDGKWFCGEEDIQSLPKEDIPNFIYTYGDFAIRMSESEEDAKDVIGRINLINSLNRILNCIQPSVKMEIIERSKNRSVVRWASFKETKGMPISIKGFDGWFIQGKKGQHWESYLEAIGESLIPYANAIRESVIKNNIRYKGSEHIYSDNGIPVFDNNTIGVFSFHAWGDIMAAIWSDIDNRDYTYIDFI